MTDNTQKEPLKHENRLNLYINNVKSQLNGLSTECKVHCLILANVAAFALYHVFVESVDHDSDVTASKQRVLGDGWWAMSRKKDIADFEWSFWFSEARFALISMLVSHTTVSLLCKRILPEAREGILFAHDILWVYGLLGGSYVITMTLLCVAYFYVTRFSDEMYLWCFTVGLLLTTQIASLDMLLSHLGSNTYSVMAHSSFVLAIFRCCSFGLESCRPRKSGTSQHDFSALELLRYNFYLPYFFFGPVMTFDCFVQEKEQTSSENPRHILIDIARIIGYVVVVDFLLHYFHISSLPLDAEFMQSSPSIVLGFLAFANVFLDWMKGRLLYAVSGSVARHVDGYEGAPKGCKNIATIYTFADTYFDRGIQHWLCRYVYDPLGEGHQKVYKEALAGGVSFVVVILLQGVSVQTVLWAFLNWFGLTFEFYLNQRFQHTRQKHVKVMFLGLNYWCILLFNCIGINGIDSFGWYVSKLFIQGGFVGILLTYLLGYSYVCVNMELQEKQRKEMKKE